MINSPAPIHHIALYAPQGCSMLSYGLISEPFLLANRLLGVDKYKLSLISEPDGRWPFLDSGVFKQGNLSVQQGYQLLMIVAETLPEQTISLETKKSLQRYYRQQAGQIITLNAGVCWLLDSGIGLDKNWVVHWSLMDEIKDRYPKVTLSHELYQKEQRLTSCAGQLAILDYLLNYLATQEQESIVEQISDHLCLDRQRNSDERQRLPSNSFAGEDIQPRLTMAIALMESNIEKPLSCDEIANKVHISRRQLERLFKRYMNTMPARYYLQIRLKRAQQLLKNSNLSIVQIGLSCGFSSGPHFSSSYKAFYQTTPREERTKSFAN